MRRIIRALVGWMALMAVAAPGQLATAQQINLNQSAQVALPLMRTAPNVDGVIGEEEWAGATRVVGMAEYGSGLLTPRIATFWFGCDGKRVYAAVKSETPTIGNLLARVRKANGPVWNDDGIEVWLAPHVTKTAGDRRYFQFIGNPIGTIYQIAFQPGAASSVWNGDWEFRNSIAEGFWSSEASVSLESLGVKPEDLANEWRVHVCRDWQQPGQYASWSNALGGFQNTDAMTRVRWDSTAPVTQVLQLGEVFAGKVDFKVAVANPGDKPLAVKARLVVQPTNQPWFHEEKVLSLAPGSREVASLQRKVEVAKYLAAITVTSTDEKTLYFARNFGWDKRPEFVWTTVKREAKAVDFTVSYYPYHRKLRGRVDFSGLSAAASVREAVLALTRKEEKTPLAAGTISQFKDNTGEVILDTPDLKAGTYAVSLTLEGDAGVPREPFVQTFDRTVWEWEHNSIGISRRVIPPFTPLEVKSARDLGRGTRGEASGPVVGCVLRTHEMNGFGLWNQVVSKGEPILSAPMRLEAKVNGTSLNWKTGPPKFTEKNPDRVTAFAVFEGGQLVGKVISTFDYDGLMKVDLELSQKGQDNIESLDLLIPLRNEVAPLMHVCSDGIRANYAGRVPEGQGVVWDSSKAVKYEISGTWVPYIWLGGIERGLCYVAEADRDWVLDDKVPALDLLRSGDAVTLRLHLINTPTKLTRPHHLVFALQATPVKPMPVLANGTSWRRWSFYGKYPGVEQMTIMGSCPYWGAASSYSDVYPRKRDFTLFERFRETRQTGKWDPAFVNEWLKGYEDQSQMQMHRAHVECGFRMMAGGGRFIPYTNARGGCAGPEGQSFAAETWFEPVRSFQDLALFYFRKMMDSGIDGIYYDNTYAAPNRDTVSGRAYIRPDGSVQPSMGIFSMRDLIKRTAVMYREAGKEPLTVVHMTNGNIIPALSFATISLDWEDKYGAAEFQDKFSTDFIMAESMGRQAGMMPLVLGGVVTEDEKERLRLARTEFGVTLVHEIKMWNDGRCPGVEKAYAALFAFGYGEYDCEVFPYWEGNQPVEVVGSDTHALVLSRGGKVMVIVTDYGNGGALSLTPDKKRLGLKANFTAKDAETGEVLVVTDGRVTLPIKRRDFRMVVLE